MTFKHLYRDFKQFFRYALVGASGTFLDLGSLFIFVEYVKLPLLLAATFSFILAVVNNFLLNKLWTFKDPSKNYRKLFIKFLIVSLVGLGLTLSLMHLLVNVFMIWYMISKAITSLVVLTWNFLGNKLWTFKSKKFESNNQENFLYDLSIVLPAYNEENRIKSTLILINDYVLSTDLNAEIIVVDDGSKDRTVEILEACKGKIKNLKVESYKQNQGKGFAVKTGILSSKGKYILVADADNSTPIEELENLMKELKESKAQIAIGSRYLAASKVQVRQPRYRIILGRLGNILIRMFLIDGIKDTQCGFKLFEHNVAKNIFSLQKVKRFGFDMEMIVIATSLDYKIVEVPVSWFNSVESRVRPIKDAIITLKDLFYIKINLWSGRYKVE